MGATVEPGNRTTKNRKIRGLMARRINDRDSGEPL